MTLSQVIKQLQGPRGRKVGEKVLNDCRIQIYGGGIFQPAFGIIHFESIEEYLRNVEAIDRKLRKRGDTYEDYSLCSKIIYRLLIRPVETALNVPASFLNVGYGIENLTVASIERHDLSQEDPFKEAGIRSSYKAEFRGNSETIDGFIVIHRRDSDPFSGVKVGDRVNITGIPDILEYEKRFNLATVERI